MRPKDKVNEGTSGLKPEYDDDSIITLDWKEHIRLRPSMYIGAIGDGSNFEDGIYVLLKEVIDNSLDEYVMGFGNEIIVNFTSEEVEVRDFGRGIPLKSVIDVSSKINTGGRFDSKVFEKTIGQNGVGIKAVNALSECFEISSFREGKGKSATFKKGTLTETYDLDNIKELNGTFVRFRPDKTIFRDYEFKEIYINQLIKNYSYVNSGLTFIVNGMKISSKKGLLNLLQDKVKENLYEPFHIVKKDIEIAFTHTSQSGEEFYSFANGANTIYGGYHLTAFREVVARAIKDYYKKDFELSDIRGGIVGAVSIRVEEPVFESQAKKRLTCNEMKPNGVSILKFLNENIKMEIDNYLHRNPSVADIILKRILQTSKERKSLTGITKLSREKKKRLNINNKKLYDCRFHFNDKKGDGEKKEASSIFITEGDSAAGSITKVRDTQTQAVFALRGKTKNTYGKTLTDIYDNEELNLLLSALGIEDGIDNLRYNKVIIATDADVDGMHIRLLLLTFFLQYYPELIKTNHIFILQTPLFRVRNKETSKRSRAKGNDRSKIYYCYSNEDRIKAINLLGPKAEITRFKGLGEISPDEFKDFIGDSMRLDRVVIGENDNVKQILEFYMGKNTRIRQEFIIDNLIVEDDSEINNTPITGLL